MVGLICPLFGIGLTELPRAPHFSLIANRYVNFRFKLKSKQYPQINPVLGVGPAPRVNDWVQSGSGWPPGSEIYQIIQFQAVLAKFDQLQLPINHTNYVVN